MASVIDVMAKQYSANGLLGCVEQRKNRRTGTKIGLYHGLQSGIDSDPECPWATVCEDHGFLVNHQSLANAKIAMTVPDWCEECQKILYPENSTPELGLGYMQGKGAS